MEPQNHKVGGSGYYVAYSLTRARCSRRRSDGVGANGQANERDERKRWRASSPHEVSRAPVNARSSPIEGNSRVGRRRAQGYGCAPHAALRCESIQRFDRRSRGLARPEFVSTHDRERRCSAAGSAGIMRRYDLEKNRRGACPRNLGAPWRITRGPRRRRASASSTDTGSWRTGILPIRRCGGGPVVGARFRGVPRRTTVGDCVRRTCGG